MTRTLKARIIAIIAVAMFIVAAVAITRAPEATEAASHCGWYCPPTIYVDWATSGNVYVTPYGQAPVSNFSIYESPQFCLRFLTC